MILTTLVAAVALGITAQILAERFQIAAILPLLVFGVLFGPDGLGLFQPAALGEVLEVLIHLGVAIILFEGGLSLDPHRLREVGRPVINLLTIGVAVTGVGSAALAHHILGMQWPVAALFGAIMTVTGPTVIVPLLRHMVSPREVKTVLLSEGLIIDPIGAVLAYVALQWIGRSGVPWRELSAQMLTLAATGVVLGFVAGAVAKVIVRSRLVTGELRNLSILALLMVCYLVSEEQAHQSGILAAVVMGFTMSAAELPDLVSVKAFKGQLTTLVISALFILLAGQLDLQAVAELGLRGALLVGALVLIVRPLSVLLSVWPGQLPWRQRLVLAMTAPRGIVAAAVASLAAHQMSRIGVAGGEALEGMVYLAIVVTGAWSTVAALALPKLLGWADDPARRRAVLVGANRLTEELAKLLNASGRSTTVVDSVSWRLERIRAIGLTSVCGDARDSATYEEAGVERDSLVVVATTNDELNLLVAELVHTEFGVDHPVVALQRPPEGFGRRSRAWIDLLGGRALDVPRWIRRLENHSASLIEVAPGVPENVALLREVEREHGNAVVRMVSDHGGEISFKVSEDHTQQADNLILLVADGRAAEIFAERAVDPTRAEQAAAASTENSALSEEMS